MHWVPFNLAMKWYLCACAPADYAPSHGDSITERISLNLPLTKLISLKDYLEIEQNQGKYQQIVLTFTLHLLSYIFA